MFLKQLFLNKTRKALSINVLRVLKMFNNYIFEYFV